MSPNQAAPSLQFATGANVNPDWYASKRGMLLTTKRNPILNSMSKVFTMGSCFAYEVRSALKAKGIDIYPKWEALPIDFNTQIVAKLHDDDNINHYDTHVLLQELRDAFTEPNLGEADFLQLSETPAGKRLGVDTVWQDPYRKQTYASSFAALSDISKKFSACIRDGIEKSDVLVITLGLIELWRNPKNGRFFCRPPGTGFNAGRGSDTADFYYSSFEENMENLRKITDLILSRFPDKHIIFSVSPVALERTFSGQDIIVANTYSKSVLRAALGQLLLEQEPTQRVHYMPAFEIAQRIDIFAEDGRHVTKSAANFIIEVFRYTFFDKP